MYSKAAGISKVAISFFNHRQGYFNYDILIATIESEVPEFFFFWVKSCVVSAVVSSSVVSEPNLFIVKYYLLNCVFCILRRILDWQL